MKSAQTPSDAMITAGAGFLARVQISESRRARLWLIVLVGMLTLTIIRRVSRGMVMLDDDVFYPTVVVLASAVAIQIGLVIWLRRANRLGKLVPSIVWPMSALADLGVPAALLTINALESPRGEVAALSGAALLLMPIVILTSILRLRPMFTLGTAVAGAIFHGALTARAIDVAHVAREQYPDLFAHSCVLLLLGFAGMLVARELRSQVLETTLEAVAHAQARQHIATVERDLSTARRIQSRLLPLSAPELAGFDIAGMQRTALAHGGDSYDWQNLQDDKVVIALADVAGHGIGSAITTAACRAYGRASAAVVRDPAVMMSQLNALLLADLPADRLTTFSLAIIHASGRIDLLATGSAPTFLHRAADRSTSALAAGTPAASMTMEAGDLLVMLTDGFATWQRSRDGQPFGVGRLQSTIATAARRPAAAIVAALDLAVRDFAGDADQPDDMTAVVIRRADAR